MMRMLFAVGFLITPLFSQAQISDQTRSPWSAGVLALNQASPYVGGDESPAIFPFVAYRGEKLLWQGPSLDYFLIGSTFGNGPAVSVNLSLAPNELDTNNDPRLAGINDRDNSFMLGVNGRYPLWGGAVRALLQTEAIGDHSGQRFTIGWQRPIISGERGRWQIQGGVQLEYLSSNYADYYFGVSEREAAQSVYSAWRVGAQTQAAITLNGRYRFNQQWMLIGSASVTSLPDDIKDSPIVADSNVANGFIAVTYQF